MSFVKLSCPSCGANIEIDDNREFGFCSYCGTKVVQDKIIVEHKGKISVSGVADEKTILNRIFLFLDDSDWENAQKYSEKLLDVNPESAYAYIGKLMADLHITKIEQLQNCSYPLDKNANYFKALRFGSNELIADLQKCNDYIKHRKEIERKSTIYDNAKKDVKNACDYYSYKAISDAFYTISDFKDAKELANKYKDKALECKKIENRKSTIKKATILSIIVIVIALIIFSIVKNNIISE